MTTLATKLRDLASEYLALHVRKEDAFWALRMGITDDADVAARTNGEAEIAWQSWLQDPDRLRALRGLDAAAGGTDAERRVLRGWIAMLAANVIEDPAARDLSRRIVEAEQTLGRARYTMDLGFVDPATGKRESASSVKLSLMLRADPDSARRKAAFDGLRSIETHVLDHGFLDLVRMRNRLARLLGHEDFYAWRVAVVEGMPKARVFGLLDELERRTRARSREELDRFVRDKGEEARLPWHYAWLRQGALNERIDPYFRFDDALSRWGRAFHALGVRYRGATLTLDLVDRAGKYENGFMHGPEPAFLDAGTWHPARIAFTANAVPGAVGSGLRATETLFHEGGHAAHFANITEPAPCFSQEFAPTSVAYAETQSMFMDSLLGDPDFRVRYAKDAHGVAMPDALILDAIREEQPFRAHDVRMLMTVPFAERALYELPDGELSPEHVLATFRRVERELQGLDSATRPVLATPHLLAGESSAYYHGYVLARMAVEQTRDFFVARDGYLTDNARIGPDLARTYWQHGNAVGFDDTLRALTDEGLSADALATVVTRPVDAALSEARASIDAARKRAPASGHVELDAKLRVVHGREQICESRSAADFDAAASRFGAWVRDAEERERHTERARPAAP